MKKGRAKAAYKGRLNLDSEDYVMFKDLLGRRCKGKLSQTKRAKAMRKMRRTETKAEKKARCAKHRAALKRYEAFAKRVAKYDL